MSAKNPEESKVKEKSREDDFSGHKKFMQKMIINDVKKFKKNNQLRLVPSDIIYTTGQINLLSKYSADNDEQYQKLIETLEYGEYMAKVIQQENSFKEEQQRKERELIKLAKEEKESRTKRKGGKRTRKHTRRTYNK